MPVTVPLLFVSALPPSCAIVVMSCTTVPELLVVALPLPVNVKMYDPIVPVLFDVACPRPLAVVSSISALMPEFVAVTLPSTLVVVIPLLVPELVVVRLNAPS